MTEPPEPVAAAWTACEEQWDDTARHEAFFVLVAQHDCFPFAAARYKPRAGDPVADRALERIRKAVTAKMMATAAPRTDPKTSKSYRAMLALIVLMLVAAIAGLAYVANMRRGPAHGAPTPESH